MTTIFHVLVALFISAVSGFCVMVAVPRWRERAMDLVPWIWGLCGLCWFVRALIH